MIGWRMKKCADSSFHDAFVSYEGPNSYFGHNEGKSPVSFFHEVAAWFPDMICIFYFVKNHKIAKISTTTKAREEISTDLGVVCKQRHSLG